MGPYARLECNLSAWALLVDEIGLWFRKRQTLSGEKGDYLSDNFLALGLSDAAHNFLKQAFLKGE